MIYAITYQLSRSFFCNDDKYKNFFFAIVSLCNEWLHSIMLNSVPLKGAHQLMLLIRNPQ